MDTTPPERVEVSGGAHSVARGAHAGRRIGGGATAPRDVEAELEQEAAEPAAGGSGKRPRLASRKSKGAVAVPKQRPDPAAAVAKRRAVEEAIAEPVVETGRGCRKKTAKVN